MVMALIIFNVYLWAHTQFLMHSIDFLMVLLVARLESPPCCTLFCSIYLVLHFTHSKQKERRDENANISFVCV